MCFFYQLYLYLVRHGPCLRWRGSVGTSLPNPRPPPSGRDWPWTEGRCGLPFPEEGGKPRCFWPQTRPWVGPSPERVVPLVPAPSPVQRWPPAPVVRMETSTMTMMRTTATTRRGMTCHLVIVRWLLTVVRCRSRGRKEKFPRKYHVRQDSRETHRHSISNKATSSSSGVRLPSKLFYPAKSFFTTSLKKPQSWKINSKMVRCTETTNLLQTLEVTNLKVSILVEYRVKMTYQTAHVSSFNLIPLKDTIPTGLQIFRVFT